MKIKINQNEIRVDSNRWYGIWTWGHQFAAGITGCNHGLVINSEGHDKKGNATKQRKSQEKEFMRQHPQQLVSKNQGKVGKAYTIGYTVHGTKLEDKIQELSGKPYYPTITIIN